MSLPNPRRRPTQFERSEGRALMRMIMGCWWAPWLHHSPNEEINPLARQIAAGQGTRPGFPDYILPIAHGKHVGCAIELKAPHPHGRKPSHAEALWIDFLRDQGWRAEVCYGAEIAYALLLDYMKDGQAPP